MENFTQYAKENKHDLFDINILIKHSMHIEAYAKFRGTKLSNSWLNAKNGSNHQIIPIYDHCFNATLFQWASPIDPPITNYNQHRCKHNMSEL